MMKKQMKKGLLLFALLIGMCCIPVTIHAKESVEFPTVYGSNIKDGSYEVEMESSSSMFRIVKAQLDVSAGNMTVTMTLSGVGYLKLFMGTGEEALEASEESFIPYVEDDEGAYTYTIPVKALNVEFDCAAYSKRKQRWYDRKLSVLASSLPAEAFFQEDGEYSMEVTLSGGSGRAVVISPAEIRVSQGAMTAVIEWSSQNYDYMVVDNIKYLPVNTEGHSVFEIPVPALDKEVEVTADTVAMSKPHEIAYTLTFDSNTLQKEQRINGKMIPIVVVGVTVIVAIVLIFILKKKDQND